MDNNKKIKQIDFVEIAKKLYQYKKLYCCVLPLTLVIVYLVMACIPRYYVCTVTLAPESASGSGMPSSLSSVSSMLGLGAALNKMNSSDALYSEIYPDILQSSDFIAELMTTDVKTQDGNIKCNYYSYLKNEQKCPWWEAMLSWVQSGFSKDDDTYDGKKVLSTFNLTKAQTDLFNLAKKKIGCFIDKKTEIVSIQVTDQDPLVSATMAKVTCAKLQNFIINYRTNKARIDFEYYKKLCQESKQRYERARQLYASFADSNQDVVLASYRVKQEDLENDMQIKYNIYTAMNTQLQGAEAKLQEATPAFTIIQNATVPVKPAGPKRVITALIMTFLIFIVMSVYIIVRD